jgi:uncharacterized membrane protein YdjX (TVP38/TMEM64 family)
VNNLRNFFWALALGVIAAYLFFFALGAFAFDDVLPLSIAVAVLILLWTVHALLQSRRHERDPQLAHARERRGF